MSEAGRERTRLYLITPPRIDPVPFSETLTRALEAGDAACLQLRLKEVPEDEVRRAAEILLPVCQAYDVALLINDDPRIAKAVGADGAHVGQEDMSYRDARTLLGPDAIIGVTCHDSRHLAMVAGEDGADYVAFGAFFPTTTKVVTRRATPDLLREAATLGVPRVAIGGITPDNGRALVGAGADLLAVVGGVFDVPDPLAAVAAYRRCFEPAAG